MNLFIGFYVIFLFALLYIINKICTIFINKINKMNNNKELLLEYRKIYNDKIEIYNKVFSEIIILNKKNKNHTQIYNQLKNEYKNIRNNCKKLGNNLYPTIINLFNDYRNSILPN